jgi:hypothetical protein
MVYCTLEEAWGNDFCTDNSCSNIVVNNISSLNDTENEHTDNINVQAISVMPNPQLTQQQQIMQPPQQQIMQPLQQQIMQPPQQQIMQPPQQQIMQPPQQQVIQPPQQQIMQPQPTNIPQESNNSINQLYSIINQLRTENNDLKRKLQNKFNINIDNLPELFLYGILIFLVIDLLIGFKKK